MCLLNGSRNYLDGLSSSNLLELVFCGLMGWYRFYYLLMFGLG